MPWIIETEVGYANGADDQVNAPAPTYEDIGARGYAETVRVKYNSQAVSLKTLVRRFFEVIDPYSADKQGGDVGSQYRTGIYYTDLSDEVIIGEVIAEVKNPDQVVVENERLREFYPAEDYHQDYLQKNTGGYCHIPLAALTKKWPLIDKELYPRPSLEVIKKRLNDQQFKVTQVSDTERPFTGEYTNNHEKGIYVDVVTGEPLFISADQFDSGCGWPSFSKPIDQAVVTEHVDTTAGRERTEIRSSAGDSHLGHVFDDGPEELGGLRYCINSASLRFIPSGEMRSKGYNYLLELV